MRTAKALARCAGSFEPSLVAYVITDEYHNLMSWLISIMQDKSADYSLANSVGVRNNIFAILILGTYEVLMEHCYILGNMRYVVVD